MVDNCWKCVFSCDMSLNSLEAVNSFELNYIYIYICNVDSGTELYICEIKFLVFTSIILSDYIEEL